MLCWPALRAVTLAGAGRARRRAAVAAHVTRCVLPLILVAAPVAAAAPPGATTLPEVLRDVLRDNRDLEMRGWEAAATRARAARAGSWESPSVEIGVENVPATGRFDEDPMTMKTIGLSQRVPVFGANRLMRRAENEQLRADTSSLSALRWERCGEAWETYSEAYFAGVRAAAAERHHDVMQRMVASARARYESGRGRLDDLLRPQAEAARVDADAAAWRASEVESRADLATLRGIGAAAPAVPLAAPPALEVGDDPRPWVDAALRHPRVREQEARVSRWRLAARAARRSAWPELELRASYGLRQTLKNPIHGGSTEQDNMFSAMLGFTVPVFAGSRELAEAREMDAMAHAAEAERGGAELALEQAVVTAHARAVAGARTVRLISDTVLVLQRRSLDANWSAYSAGTSDLLGVFDAAHMLYAEELREAEERQALAQAHARLIALTGRFDLIGVALPGTARGKERP